jgi:hypothetical protein
MKKYTIMFWIATGAIFLFEGVMPALTGMSKMSVDGITGLGYPLYFVPMLVVFKVLGSLALIIPQVPARIKEWAYAGFAIDFIAAFVSIVAVAGWNTIAIMPVVAIIILTISYVSREKLKAAVTI